MLFRGGLFRERPRQHEFGLEHRLRLFDQAIEGGGHPRNGWMRNALLHRSQPVTGVALIPMPVELLGDEAQLDDQLARKVRRLDFTALFAPKAEESGFVAPHNDPSVGAADKAAPIR